jgi:hypothetical protein
MLQFLMSCLRREHARPRSTAMSPARPGGLPPGARMIDVEGMIRQASTRVSVDQLIKSGKKHVNLLSRDKIDELINRSVKTIVDKHRATTAHKNAASQAQIEAESRAEFEELLHQFQETADVKSAVEHSKQTLEQELEEIRFELDPEKVGEDEASPTPVRAGSPAPFEDFVRELDRQVVHVFANRRLILERSESPEAMAELDRIEGVLGTILANLVHAAGERFRAPAGDPHEIATLKKRMEKLYAYIATMEAALKTLSTAKTFSNQQVQNLLRDLGLTQEDKNFEKKRDMLKVVLSANQEIRKKARELAARGITLDAPEEKAVFTSASDSSSRVFERSSV